MIKCNGKDVIPRLNGKELSRVMYNGAQIYPEKTNYVFTVPVNEVTLQKNSGSSVNINNIISTANNKVIPFDVNNSNIANISKTNNSLTITAKSNRNVVGVKSLGILELVQNDSGLTHNIEVFQEGTGNYFTFVYQGADTLNNAIFTVDSYVPNDVEYALSEAVQIIPKNVYQITRVMNSQGKFENAFPDDATSNYSRFISCYEYVYGSWQIKGTGFPTPEHLWVSYGY